MRRAGRAIILGLLLAGCGRAEREASTPDDGAGLALEKAAVAAGIVADPRHLDPVGAYASATDRVCIVRQDGALQIGASIDYGDRQSCVARGAASGRETLKLDFGEACSFEARFDGERIAFPAVLPSGCDRRCTGRATMTALSAGRLSSADAEARAMRGPDGEPLCG